MSTYHSCNSSKVLYPVILHIHRILQKSTTYNSKTPLLSFFFKKRTLHSLATTGPSSFPLSPEHHKPNFFLCGFAYYKHFIQKKSCNMHPLLSIFFYGTQSLQGFSCCSLHQCSIPFHCQILFYFMTIAHLVYSSADWHSVYFMATLLFHSDT